jgi:hypothetical protein
MSILLPIWLSVVVVVVIIVYTIVFWTMIFQLTGRTLIWKEGPTWTGNA